MNEIFIKQELDVETAELTAKGVNVKSEIEEEDEETEICWNNRTTKVSSAPTPATPDNAALKLEPLPYKDACESFIIYELKEEPTMSGCIAGVPTASKTNATTTTRVPRVVATKPKILNIQLRNKRNFTTFLKRNSSESSASIITEKSSLLDGSPESKPISTVPKVSTLSEADPKRVPPTTTQSRGELQVKCFCRLGYSATSTAATDTNTTAAAQELQSFFMEMFHKTRQQSRAHQREVKLKLLQAVSESEELYEAGRNCDKCCFNGQSRDRST